VSAAPLDERVSARAQLDHVARSLYADPVAALRAMRHEAHEAGPEAVRRRLEQDFGEYGTPDPRVQGVARERAQQVLRDGLAADVEGWLRLDHQPPRPQLVVDHEISAPCHMFR
jgi:hypothetical protein